MATVQFNDVGRDRQSWVTEMTSLTRPEILKQIRRHGAAIGKAPHLGLKIQWDEKGRNAEILEGIKEPKVVGRIHIIRFAL